MHNVVKALKKVNRIMERWKQKMQLSLGEEKLTKLWEIKTELWLVLIWRIDPMERPICEQR